MLILPKFVLPFAEISLLFGIQQPATEFWAIVNIVGFQIVTRVVTKRSIFWNITVCSPLIVKVLVEDVTSIFGAEVRKARNQQWTLQLPASHWFLAWFISLKHQLTFKEMQSVISQKIEFLLTILLSRYEGK
jgi:hypothetical protein